MDELNPNRYKRSNARLIRYCLVPSTLAVIYGMGIAQTGGFLAMSEYNQDFGEYNSATGSKALTAPQISGLTGTTLGAACVSAIFAGTVGTRYGRKIGLTLAALLYVIGLILNCAATSYAFVIVGKVILGLAVGLAANFVIAYWAETSPVKMRGLITLLYGAITNLAQFVGACIVKGTSELTTSWAWRASLMTEFIPPLILLTFIYWIPETPRWYASHGKNAQAREAMCHVRGPTWPEEEIDAEIDDIVGMLEIERQLEGSSSWIHCFQGTDLRRTLLAIFALLGQEFSGVAFIAGYGTLFFSLSGVTDPFTTNVISSMCGIAGSLTSFVLVKYVGRRKILVGGTVVQTFCMFAFAIIGVATPGTHAAAKSLVAFVCIFNFSYGASWGPVAFVLIGELPSTKLRSKTLALATSVGWSFNVLISVGMPYLLSDAYVMLGTKVGFIFGATELLAFVFAFFFLPETKDRTLEEIDEMFMNKVPAWEFKNYVTTKTVQGISVGSEMVNVIGEDKGAISHVDRAA
ncbi:uncharacterized protein Z520_10389 [Fonsecaea multimorphosa CBS 102226]|uniref:Major facilitator superfamily (MFS) profile domain-containing protein n=1 Tax=Fonsecaea multimorphosa CBS 102226 TaxID=1442371 RepID=A0A0D2GVW6_9EURO|nr:uncharacterized protein Z520_10389 [Fonsecaea multimorphosa CBS 102226]KIX93765.1 hypothetical protein Z520_10389 [Fonsecaea multimorphosa CBS 102226]